VAEELSPAQPSPADLPLSALFSFFNDDPFTQHPLAGDFEAVSGLRALLERGLEGSQASEAYRIIALALCGEVARMREVD
jgi:hypothetical protein